MAEPFGVFYFPVLMVKQDVIANYPMSQGDLILTSGFKLAFLERDLDDLAKRGLKQERLTSFEKQVEAAAKLPSDEQLDRQKQELTDAATAQRTVAEGGMAEVMSIVAIKNKPTTAAYKTFGSAGLYNASEGDFYVNLGHLLDWADTQVAAYAGQGLTPEMLTDLRAENEKYLLALKAQRLAISTRSAATQTRQIALNALYTELADLCGLGAGFYKQTDKAKHDDYIIDPTVHSDKPVPPVG